MRPKETLAVVLSLMLLYAQVPSVNASVVAGKMITRGSAEINGVAAPSVTSVFIGDHIATQKESVTSMNFAGGDAVVMPELTKAALGSRGGHYTVNLEDGTVSILNKTHTPIVVEAHGVLIEAAANQSALFDVTIHGNELRVTARGGEARVESAAGTSEVPAGSELSATLAPTPAPVAGMTSAPTLALVVIGAVAVTGAVLGGVAYARTNDCTVSPSSNKVVC